MGTICLSVNLLSVLDGFGVGPQTFKPLSFTIYLEIVLSIKSTNQKHGGFDVTVSLFSWGHPLTTAHA